MKKEVIDVKSIDDEIGVSEVNILIIEDDEDQFEIIKDSIDDFNQEDKSHIIKYTWVSSYNEALVNLISMEFDSAIVDLQLDSSKSNTNELDGNKVIEIIFNKLRFPVFVRTGFPAKVQAKEHNFFKVYNKTHSVDDIIIQIISLYNKGISDTIGTKGKLERYLNEIYWKRLSNNINEWNNDFLQNKEHETSLVRYCMSLLMEYLELNIEGNQFLEYHPFEVFIKPPIKSDPFFGDILYDRGRGQYLIILSPSCDMAQKKFEKITIAEIEPLENIRELNEFKENYHRAVRENKPSKANTAKRKITEIAGNNFKDKYHFLPSYQEFPGGLINFQKIHSITSEQLRNFDTFASVNNKFGKDITARFSQYFSRQGQPNFNDDIVLKDILGVEQLV